jgi:RNA polymerase sigma factor (sigma-70 family)
MNDARSVAVIEHGGRLVRSVCQRMLGPRHPLCDDACQAVFLIILRKQPRLGEPHLDGWLHTIARRVCLQVMRNERLRKRRESQAAEHQPFIEEPMSQPDLAHELDTALSRLSARQREAVLRHFVEGKSQAAIAGELGVSEGAIKKRVADAVENMRHYFSRRGIATTSAVLAVMLSQDASAEPPFPLPAATPAANTIAQGIIRNMIIRKISIGAFGALFLAGGIIGALPSRAAEPIPMAHVASAQKNDPSSAILRPLQAIRHNDLAQLLACLPAGKKSELEASWRKLTSTMTAEEEATADLVLALVTNEKAPSYLKIAGPLSDDFRIALKHMMDRYPFSDRHMEFQPNHRTASTGLISDVWVEFQRWSKEHPASEESVRISAQCRHDSALALQVSSIAELRKMEFPTIVERASSVMQTIKAAYAKIGLDLDSVLDSVKIDTVTGTGDLRRATVRLHVFERDVRSTVELVRQDGVWHCPELETFLDNLFWASLEEFYPSDLQP